MAATTTAISCNFKLLYLACYSTDFEKIFRFVNELKMSLILDQLVFCLSLPFKMVSNFITFESVHIYTCLCSEHEWVITKQNFHGFCLFIYLLFMFPVTRILRDGTTTSPERCFSADCSLCDKDACSTRILWSLPSQSATLFQRSYGECPNVDHKV